MDRADAGPRVAEAVQRYILFDALADVFRRKAGPDYVGDIGGTVVEDVDLDAVVMGAGEERVATADAGAHHAEAFTSTTAWRVASIDRATLEDMA